MAASKSKSQLPSGKVKATYALPEKLADRIAFAAIRRKMSRSEVVEELLTLGLKRHPKAESPDAGLDPTEAGAVVL